MIHFFGNVKNSIFAVQASKAFSKQTVAKFIWLFGNQPKIETMAIDTPFIGPRAAMITPWSTNAVEITQNMGITGILRIEKFQAINKNFKGFDPMISEKFKALNQSIFDI
ncbi:MAG: hypothetical protein VXY75_06675, partial [Bacteroidota bacterium]|nr:hypothetical protein [Bacteroidota bacterium]